ncbi:hydantoinase/oxoprolinase family protein [bacterium]|nr:MAG: hydantoinase/oxoprolinase family protein [bacterium]
MSNVSKIKKRVAVDIGGTFTDICILNEESGEIRIAKTASTPADPIIGAMRGLSEANIDLHDVTLFAHGTTVATNALITRNLPLSAMICTRGFRDVIEIRRANKEELWDTYKDPAPAYIRRRDRLEVTERIDYAGQIVKALDEDEARELARILKKREVLVVAVCFINAHINGAHEMRMKAILEEELPGVAVVTSSETLPEIFEHERFSTTVVNAMLKPVVSNYVLRLDDELRSKGYESDLLLLHSGGGVITTTSADKFAARLAGSGIAAGAIACRYIAGECGFENAIGVDMGGTSCDVSLTFAGENHVTKEWGIEFGYPIRFPSIEVLTIGAGGGSLAWIDGAGALHSGPQSAGADPGPVCYGKGGTVPTNTDANIVLGRLGTKLAGGSINLDYAMAEQAIRETIAKPLGMSVIQAAQAIIDVSNATMADAVRLLSIARGYDPRDFALLAFGGAGALHGVDLARELSVPTVIVPPYPGVTSALGCLLVDLRHDFAQSYIIPATKAKVKDIESRFSEMEAEARALMANEKVEVSELILKRSIDMMYQGQWRAIQVPVSAPFTSIDDAVRDFHIQHEREYKYRRDEVPIEFFRLNLTAIGLIEKASLYRHKSGGTLKADTTRQVFFDGAEQAIKTPIYKHEDLPVGCVIEGPAIIDQVDTTTVVPPGTRAKTDEFMNLHIDIQR